MKQKITFLLLCFSIHLFSQHTWINYANDHLIYDMELEGDQLWVGTQGGLVKIDTQTGEKETFQTWNSGLRGSGIKEVEIAENGLKWLGTENAGLFNFDGINWEQFSDINTGDKLSGIANLKLDDNDHPWFFSSENGSCVGLLCRKLFSYNGNEFQSHNENLQVTEDNNGPYDFGFLGSGELWVTFSKKVVRYNGTTIMETYDTSNSPLRENEKIGSIEVDNQDNLWLTTYEYNPYIYRILKFNGTIWSVENEEAPGQAINFFKDNNGVLWFNFLNSETHVKSYASFDGSTWQYWSVSDIPELPNFGGTPFFHMVDSQGHWWMRSYNGISEPKVYKIDGNSFTSYDTEITPINTGEYYRIIADCDNNIWIPAEEGLCKFDGQNWENFADLQPNFMGSLWDATIDQATCAKWMPYLDDNDETSILRFNGSEFETFSTGSGSWGCSVITVAPNNVIYVGMIQEGMAEYRNGTWSYFNTSNSPLHRLITEIKVQNDSTVWVSSLGEGIARKIGTEWTVFNSSNSPVQDNTWWFHLDSNDNIWVSSGSGLAKYNGTNWEIFSFNLGNGSLLSLEEDHLGNFWLGTSRGALYWNGFDFIKFNINNSNIGYNSMRNIHIDPRNGDIWFMHNNGISVLSNFTIGESISGIAFFDTNQDGLFDNNEDVRLPNQQVYLLPDSSSAITNSLGAYSFYPEEIGDYQITYEPTVPYQPVSPTTLDTFFNNEESIIDMNFATWAEDIPDSVSIDIVSGPFICNNEAIIWITFRNEGFLNLSGEITLRFDSIFAYSNSYPGVSNIDQHQVSWTFVDLAFMHSRTYQLVLSIPGVEAINQQFTFIAEIITDNQSLTTRTFDEILCSYDPNDKTATPIGESIDNYSLLTDPIQYTIRFQNKGNYFAENIIVADNIDSSLDLSTFQIISSSHEMTTTIEHDRQVIFRFNDINLPAEEQDYLGSQGYIKYQITPLSGLTQSTIIRNTASIYFDFNPPIITNTTKNILVESLFVNTSEQVSKPQALIYPNPSNAEIWIEWQRPNTHSDWNITIYDLSGKLVLRQKATTLKEKIIIPEKGLFIIKLQKDDYFQVEKIIVLEN